MIGVQKYSLKFNIPHKFHIISLKMFTLLVITVDHTVRQVFINLHLTFPYSDFGMTIDAGELGVLLDPLKMLIPRASSPTVQDGCGSITLTLEVNVWLVESMLITRHRIQMVQCYPCCGTWLRGTWITREFLVVFRECTQLFTCEGITTENGPETFTKSERSRKIEH